jgi:hypothetical protein
MSMITQQSSEVTGQRDLATWTDTRLLRALTELANARDDTGASRFLRLYPDFLAAEKADGSRRQEIAAKLPHSDVIKQVSKVLFRTPAHGVRHLGELLSEIWWGTVVGASMLFAFLIIDDLDEAVRIALLVRVTGENGNTSLLEHYSFLSLGIFLEHLRPTWVRRGQFKYEPTTPFQKALYLFWGKSPLAKVCKNPDCPAPFFIARRVQQAYCGDECATPARLEAKRKWWNAKGKQLRERSVGPSEKRERPGISRRTRH